MAVPNFTLKLHFGMSRVRPPLHAAAWEVPLEHCLLPSMARMVLATSCELISMWPSTLIPLHKFLSETKQRRPCRSTDPWKHPL